MMVAVRDLRVVMAVDSTRRYCTKTRQRAASLARVANLIVRARDRARTGSGVVPAVLHVRPADTAACFSAERLRKMPRSHGLGHAALKITLECTLWRG